MKPEKKSAAVAPDIPADEDSRLQTLRVSGLLDSLAEERFDRVTRMAKRLFDVSIALVSLVDENRQWFKSWMGLDVRETPRDISFCGHAILGEGIFVIPDAAKDYRFASNPLVVDEPKIRFYAGCPLRAANGHKLGTLCIIDQRPREFEPEDLQILRDLAKSVESELAAVRLATMDELTGISNRRGFTLLAEHDLNLAFRQATPTALVYIDLNNFKPVNDTFGHEEGDRALSAFAGQLRNTFRESDLIARMGGDEFVVLLNNTTQPVAADVVAKLEQSLDSFNTAADRGYALEFSYGIVSNQPTTHTTIDAMLADADALMYERKKRVHAESRSSAIPAPGDSALQPSLLT